MAALELQASEAHDEAVEKLIQDRLKMEERATKAWWKEERDETRADVEAAYWNEPANRAFHFLTKGKFKDEESLMEPFQLDKASLIEMTPDGETGLKKLRKNGILMTYKAEGGLHPVSEQNWVSILARIYGYKFGQSLLSE